MKRTALVALAALGLAACEAAPTQPVAEIADQPLLSRASTSVQHFETFFQATALCGEPIGDIRFFGTIRGVDHTTVDGRGETHRTRAFRVQGLQGVNLKTGTTYDVIGGAEMLTWHTHLGQEPGNALKSFHAGTLVFEPVDGGSKVIAHHAIRYLESPDGEVILDFHDWRCVSKGTRT